MPTLAAQPRAAMKCSSSRGLGRWRSTTLPPTTADTAWRDAIGNPWQPLHFVRTDNGPALTQSGELHDAGEDIMAVVPAIPPQQLGDRRFRDAHRLQFAYVAGAMANGIASVELVAAMSRAGMLGFFGAAGLSVDRVAIAVESLRRELGDAPFGINFIHSPHETETESALAELLIRRGVQLVEASAFLDLTLPLVRFRLHGIHRRPNGEIVTPNRIMAKVSRTEVAAKFLSPAPTKFVDQLVAQGLITTEQAQLARHVPMAGDVTAEADSGGHTDNRPLVALLPTIVSLRDRLQTQFQYSEPVRIGAAGGVATPASVAAAFALGAAYVVTGSINQSCVESGSSDLVRQMLAKVEQADVVMAPAADMFEMGVRVQVMKRGTMFAQRAARLYELFRLYESMEAIPAAEIARLERDLFRMSIDDVWKQTVEFWQKRDGRQVDRAKAEPRHKMALICRWYLGLSSRWANSGDQTRQMDFQVWCGPSMGAFNEWTRGSYLEMPQNRRVAHVARSLMLGAAIQTRIGFLQAQGVALPPSVTHVGALDWNGDEFHVEVN